MSGLTLRKLALRMLAPAAILVAIAIVYWPGLHGFWTRDDFMQLAFARMIGSPWPLFVRDHYFPAPGSLFRPLGFASFWLGQAVFGKSYAPHAAGDLLLHAAVALALYRVLRAAAVDRSLAMLGALAFALHPAALGTALWWSARFDVLAALFAFLAVRAALDFAARPRFAALAAVLVAVLAGLLAKETALAGVAAIGAVWIRHAWTDAKARGALLRAVAALAVVVFAFFLWRSAVIGTLASGIVADGSIASAMVHGVGAWIADLAGYLSFWPRLEAIGRVVLVVFAIGALLAAAIGMRAIGRAPPARIDLALAGAVLALAPAVLQAPIVALNGAPLSAAASSVETVMQSRLYYVALGGVAMLFVALAAAASERRDGLRSALLALLAIGVTTSGFAAHALARGFAAQTSASRALAEDVADSIDRLTLPPDRCHVVILGVEPPAEWGRFVSMDSIAKALSARLDQTSRCFVHSDATTYFNLVRSGMSLEDAAPYRARTHDGRIVPWLRVGASTVAYLDPPAPIEPSALDGFVFLRRDDGAFRDVTAEVLARRSRLTLR